MFCFARDRLFWCYAQQFRTCRHVRLLRVIIPRARSSPVSLVEALSYESTVGKEFVAPIAVIHAEFCNLSTYCFEKTHGKVDLMFLFINSLHIISLMHKQ